MKKSLLIAILVASFLMMGILVGCGGIVKGSGNLETKTYDYSDFSRVEAGSAFEVEISQSDSYSVRITADDNLFDNIEVSKSGETLKIDLKPLSFVFPITTKAEITMPNLYRLGLSGASHGTVSDFSSPENIDMELSGASSLELVNISAGNAGFNISGASKVNGNLEADDCDFEISGASSIQLEGSGKDITARASGASRVKLAAFTVINADISLSGASSGTVNLEGKLDADLSGASRLGYTGEPTMGDINTSDASSLSRE